MSTLTSYGQALSFSIGVPVHILDVKPANGLPPFQFWFYSPPSRVSLEDTVVYTVGLADQPQQGACPFVELFFQFSGKYPVEQLNNLASLLGGLIQEAAKRTHFSPNLLLRNLPIDILPGMKDILVCECAGRRPLWVEMEDRTIRVLSLIGLYPDETAQCIEKSGFNTYYAFLQQNIDFLKPRRPHLEPFSTDLTGYHLARIADLAQPPGPQEPGETWKQIIDWYARNIPTLGAQMQVEWFEAIPQLGILLGVETPDFSLAADPQQAAVEFLNLHTERIFAGAYLPEDGKSLKHNPNFVPPKESKLNV